MLAFEKISRAQFLADWQGEEEAAYVYDAIRLPERATVAAAGYDFYAPSAFSLRPGESLTVPTGIRARMPEDVVLLITPRSGQGMRYKLQLMNTVGVIDADYQHADNEGHIMIAIYNDHPDANKVLHVAQGQAFAQGIFLPYLVTDDDKTTAARHGGFGSTDKK